MNYPRGIRSGKGPTPPSTFRPRSTSGAVAQRAAAPEDPFLWCLSAAGVPLPQTEFRFAPPRRWRFDYAWPAALLAVECEGGIWTHGRHTRGAGYLRDCEKYNAAQLLGWVVLRYTPTQLASGALLETVREALS